MAYNSAYTGSQVDAAVGAVRQKETIWDGKQDELTGTEDQIVGFNTAGEAVAVAPPSSLPSGGTTGQLLTKTATGSEWADAPSGLPDGGTAGQMLYKSESGAEWGDKPVMWVNITGSTVDGFTADKTNGEIYEAFANGYAVFASLNDLSYLFPLSYASTDFSAFAGADVNDLAYMLCIMIDNGSVSFAERQLTPTTRTINGHALSADVTLDADDVGARPSTWTPTASDVGAVPTTRTVNGKALSANITLTADDVGAAPAITLTTATLTTSGWSSNSQTVTVSGVLADSSAQAIDVVPASKTDATNWAAAGIWCTAQGANSLTFTCDTTPTAAITVNVRIQGV